MKKAGDDMIYNLPEMKRKNDRVEEQLGILKKEYMQPHMSRKQLEKLQEKMKEAEMDNRRERTIKRIRKIMAIAACIISILIILPNTSANIAYAMEQIPILGSFVRVVTFRDYKYDGDRYMADIDVPKLQISSSIEDDNVRENMENTVGEINSEIQGIVDEIVANFEMDLQDGEGYQDVIVKSEVLSTTEDYFTLKLFCYQGAGSGYQWNYYYTIDLKTGERMQLKDLFVEGADYITLISDNIKQQMRAQMQADEDVCYWVDDEIEALNFKTITEGTSFYLNEKDNVVIGFNEGDVAPMYMGAVEFEIPADVLSDIRK